MAAEAPSSTLVYEIYNPSYPASDLTCSGCHQNISKTFVQLKCVAIERITRSHIHLDCLKSQTRERSQKLQLKIREAVLRKESLSDPQLQVLFFQRKAVNDLMAAIFRERLLQLQRDLKNAMIIQNGTTLHNIKSALQQAEIPLKSPESVPEKKDDGSVATQRRLLEIDDRLYIIKQTIDDVEDVDETEEEEESFDEDLVSAVKRQIEGHPLAGDQEMTKNANNNLLKKIIAKILSTNDKLSKKQEMAKEDSLEKNEIEREIDRLFSSLNSYSVIPDANVELPSTEPSPKLNTILRLNDLTYQEKLDEIKKQLSQIEEEIEDPDKIQKFMRSLADIQELVNLLKEKQFEEEQKTLLDQHPQLYKWYENHKLMSDPTNKS